MRIAEPVVATSEVFQEPRQLTDDMIEGVSSRSVAISARSEGEDMTTRAISSPENRIIPYEGITDISARIRRTNRARRLSHDSVDSVRTAESDSDGSGRSQVESKASDSVRIAEPVATREVNQESCKIADDMIEGVSSRSVAISARSEGEDITT